MAKNTRFLFITGGVLSSLGKGIASASLGLLLQERGHTVTIAKFDPYINVDPGTMSPFQHGEVYVTSDGAETDLDLGHYERFLDIQLSRANNTTAGQVYHDVITKERQGKYLGKTVQVVPHITNEIKKRMTTFDGKYDVVIIEIGGTVGDIESLPFLEASRQLTIEKGRSRILNVHLTYVPYIKAAGELKTKPTQHSVKTLMEYGIQPDILLCRSEHKLSRDLRNKIALFCNVEEQSVIEALDVETIYEVPLTYRRRQLDEIVCRKLDLKSERPKMTTWSRFVNKIKNPDNEVEIAFVGKYTQYKDAYKSIIEAMIHAGAVVNTKANLRWVDSEVLSEDELASALDGIHGMLVAPGFGIRGVEGKIRAIRLVRENDIPFFGICLGLQCAVIEFARNVCNLEGANSGEFGKFDHNVIDLMPDQKGLVNKGGTMRLGAYPCELKEGSKAREVYKKAVIHERHRHRYEVNNEYRGILEEHGMVFSGLSPDGTLVEMIELPEKRWFVAGQFHPEFESTAVSGHPLFVGFIKAARAYKQAK